MLSFHLLPIEYMCDGQKTTVSVVDCTKGLDPHLGPSDPCNQLLQQPEPANSIQAISGI